MTHYEIENSVNNDEQTEKMYNSSLVQTGYSTLIEMNRKINEKLVDAIFGKLKNFGETGYFRILDIGCGLSPLFPIILKKIRDTNPGAVVSYTGVDTSREMITNAHKLHRSLEDENTEIIYMETDARGLYALNEFPWFNVVVVQNYIHLVLDDTDMTNLLKFISKVLSSNSVFYISTKISVDKVEHVHDDIYIVRKNHDPSALYKRRVFDDESFKKKIVSLFEPENTYELNMFRETDCTGADFINLIGYKDPYKLYQNYRYAIGYNQKLRDLKHLLKNCTDVKEYVDDVSTMNVIRKEACMMDLFKNDHEKYLMIMNVLKEIMQEILPGSIPIYMKDKLNMNQLNWRFQLHQDATTGWRDKMKSRLADTNFITFGIPMSRVTETEQGPTRIAIRQGLMSDIVPETKPDNTVDVQRYNLRLGKDLQYLVCYGVEGSYYVFDQYVLHDSSFNLKQQNRDVFFITVATSYEENTPLFDSMEIAELFYKSKTVLDRKSIQQYLDSGFTSKDFIKDVFGKIVLRAS